MSMLSAPLDPAALLPGRWLVVATNRPCWLSGDRTGPSIEFALAGSGALSETLRYEDDRRGPVAQLASDTVVAGVLQRTPAGLFRSGRNRWAVTGALGDIIGVRFEPAFHAPGGVDIWLREGADVPEPRASVSRGLDRLGFTLQEFAALSWIAGPDLS